MKRAMLSGSGKMRGIMVKKFGGEEVLNVDDNIPIPTVNDDEVRKFIFLCYSSNIHYRIDCYNDVD